MVLRSDLMSSSVLQGWDADYSGYVWEKHCRWWSLGTFSYKFSVKYYLLVINIDLVIKILSKWLNYFIKEMKKLFYELELDGMKVI